MEYWETYGGAIAPPIFWRINMNFFNIGLAVWFEAKYQNSKLYATSSVERALSRETWFYYW
jgi:hypothetical protein